MLDIEKIKRVLSLLQDEEINEGICSKRYKNLKFAIEKEYEDELSDCLWPFSAKSEKYGECIIALDAELIRNSVHFEICIFPRCIDMSSLPEEAGEYKECIERLNDGYECETHVIGIMDRDISFLYQEEWYPCAFAHYEQAVGVPLEFHKILQSIKNGLSAERITMQL